MKPNAVQCVLAWTEDSAEFTGAPYRQDLGERPEMRPTVVAKAAMWENVATPASVDRVTEGNATARPWFGSYPSKAAAFRAAKEALAGCRRGEGRVEVYDVNPREVDADPIKTFRA